jgi:hypothetical protein
MVRLVGSNTRLSSAVGMQQPSKYAGSQYYSDRIKFSSSPASPAPPAPPACLNRQLLTEQLI